MRLDSIIRIIDNKEYEKVTVLCNRMAIFEWFDISLYNGDLIRIEKITMYGTIPNRYRLSYFTFELDDTIDRWEGEYGTNIYFILSNIYNEISKVFEIEN